MHYHVTIGVTTTWYHRATTENHSRRTFHPPNHKPMNLSPDQILALAPDPASANAGKKLANAKSWQSLGQSTDALWGECQGSALYQVRVDLRDTTVKCSCPSRKFPCKHGLGLMLLTSASSAAVPRATPPAWVDEWLARRAGAQAKREEKTNAGQPAAVADDPSTTEKRKVQAEKSAAKRARQVAKGLDALDLWLDDLIRTGLAGLELKPASFWEAQAARMVDAQVPGIATRLRALAAIPNATPEWPERLLAELGRLAMLTHAFRQIDTLPAGLQDDVRQMIGWTRKEDEVLARGEAVADDWIVLGERVTTEDRLRASRTWLLGATTGRAALVIQFAPHGAGFAETFVAGTRQQGTLVFWPGASAQRALVRDRTGQPARLDTRLPGAPAIDDFLGDAARSLALQPWRDRFPCVLQDVVPVLAGDRWLVQERSAATLPLAPGTHWTLLALAGGAPVDLAGEWDGRSLRPLGVLAGGHYHPLLEVEE